MNRKAFLLLTLFRATRSVAAGMIMIVFPYLVLQQLKYGALMLGLLYVVGALATAGLGLLVGFLGDVWGRKKALFLAGVLLPLSALLVFWSGHLAVLMVATALGGFSATGSLAGGGVGGAAAPIQSAVIADLSVRDKRTFYFSTFSFLSGAFGAVGALGARVFDVRTAFLAATLVSATASSLSLISSAPGKQGYVSDAEENEYLVKMHADPTAVLMDPSGTLGRLYDARTTPEMYVIDPEGKLIYEGAIDNRPTPDVSDIKGADNYLSDALSEAMAGKAVSTPYTRPYGCSVKYPD